MAYRLTSRARRDVLNIWSRIAEDNEPAADRFIDLVTHHFRLPGDMPYLGRQRDEIPLGYRSFPVGAYLIFYRVMKPGVHIMHVVHGYKNLLRYPFD